MIAAIYARKSTEQNGVADAEKSVTRQTEHASDYAVGKGWTVAEEHIYYDDGISGAEFANRPGFLRLMNALKPTPRFQVLIMSEESRLGREAIETAYALKQLITAGVRVFFYLEDRERTLDSPTDKIMLSLTAYTDELEREKARQRTYDAMVRKAKAGHVTGGRVFGYDNVEILGPADDQGRQKRSHVERRINDPEATVIREIFTRCAQGCGMRRIAKHLNEHGAACPRAQRGRPQSWAPSSIREGALSTALSRRDRLEPESEAGSMGPDPATRPARRRVAADQGPSAADRSVETVERGARAFEGSEEDLPPGGQRDSSGGVPQTVWSRSICSRGSARCGVCGGSLVVRSRSHGGRRAFFYGCTSYHHRGRTVCTNTLEMPLAEADEAVFVTPRDGRAQPRGVGGGAHTSRGAADDPGSRRRDAAADADGSPKEVRRRIGTVDGGSHRWGTAQDACLGDQDGERQADHIDAELAGLDGGDRVSRVERQRIERELRVRLDDWRGLLRRHVPQARQILRKLLVDRVVFTPRTDHYEFTGSWTLGKLVSGVVDLPQRMASLSVPSWNRFHGLVAGDGSATKGRLSGRLEPCVA